MKKGVIVFFVIFLAGITLFAQEPGIDEILSKHYMATGMEKLKGINTVVMLGTIIQNDAMPVKITRMRPDKYLMEFDVMDMSTFQAYDGVVAWSTAPWTGNAKPQPMPEDRARDLRSRADFEGILVNWKEKGHTVELSGIDTVENVLVYRLNVTKKDGGTENQYLGTRDYLLKKRSYTRMSRGKELQVEVFFRDYRQVGGIPFPYQQDTYLGGQLYNSVQIDEVLLNEPVDVKIFSMPE